MSTGHTHGAVGKCPGKTGVSLLCDAAAPPRAASDARVREMGRKSFTFDYARRIKREVNHGFDLRPVCGPIAFAAVT